MFFYIHNVTDALLEWLRASHDDGAPPLEAEHERDGVLVLRSDGSEPSETEQRHCRGVVAAHEAEPITRGPSDK